MRLGIGDFYFPGGPQDIAVWFAQSQFLEALRSAAPETVTALRDDVRRAYGSRLKLTKLFPDPGRLPRWTDVKPQKLRRALLAWANSFGLKTDWILDSAVRTLWQWEQYPQAAAQLSWALPEVELPDSSSRIRQRFTVSALWDPMLEPWEQFDRNLQARFDAALKQFRSRTEEVCLDAGAKRTPEKRSRSGPAEIHFQWLVQYQCRHLSLLKIADLCSTRSEILSEDTVRKAVVKVARLVRLPLRTRN